MFKIMLTDPGMYPMEEFGTDWNRIMNLLDKNATTYTYASVYNEDNTRLVFVATRKVGSDVWNCKYYSDER